MDRALKEKKGPKDYISPGLQNFRDAAGGNFADVGGAGVQIRKDWNDQSAQIKQFTDDLSKQTAGMFKDLNPFAPLKGKFIEFKNWLGKVWASLWGGIKDFASHIFDGVNIGAATSSIGDKISGFVDWIKGVWQGLVDALAAIWRLLGPDIIDIFQNLWKGIMDIWNQVAPEIAKFGDLFKPIGEAIQNVWTMAKPVLAVIGGAILFLAKIVLSVIADVIQPILSAVGGILTGLIRIIRGAVQIIVGIFTLDLGMILKGVGNIFSGLVKVIWSILKGAAQIIWGVIKGIVQGIWNFFQWLYDELVGHSIIPDMVNAIIAVFKWLVAVPKWVWDNVLVPIYNFFKTIWEKYLGPFISGMIKSAATTIQGFKFIAKWLWDNVLVPIYNYFKSIWINYLSPWITGMIKSAILIWQGLKVVVKWIWDNVLLPIANYFKGVWTGYLSPTITAIKDGIISGFKKIETLIKWVNDKFITPLKTAFSKFTDAVGAIFDKIKDKISGPIDKIKGWINNNLIDPLNKVVKLFGITIPKFSVGGAISTEGHGSNSAGRLAAGGRVPGFSSSSKADNIPAWLTANEYVQPVSTVRHYGLGVMEAIRNKQIPKEAFSNRGYFLGGLIDKGMKKVQSWMEKGPEYAVNQIMNPAKNLVSRAFPIPEFANKQAVGMVSYAQKTMIDWIHKAGGVNGQLPANPGLAGALAWAQAQVGKPYLWGGVGPDGYDCSGFMSAITNYIQGRPLFQRRFATGSMPAGIFQPGPGAFSVAWFRGNPGHTAGTLNGVNVESRGGRGVLVGSQARGATDPLFNSGVYHLPGYRLGGRVGDPPFDLISPKGKYYTPAFPPIDTRGNGVARLYGAANGAVVTGGQGGTPVMVGEGSRDELIQPLPSDWRNGRGDSGAGTTININGNLEFPNITSGDDVEELVEGLKVLAGDYS
jgi:phage-related protein